MRITNEKLEISESNVIDWGEVYELHLSGDRLILILEGNKTLELTHLPSLTVDRLFRGYENYLRSHPEMKEKKRSKRKSK